ncbi:MAG: PD40 domain-containing protein [Bacteroidetes bacterium]|nr:PD40 domain-containing protein [Bacteroidota bacterium]
MLSRMVAPLGVAFLALIVLPGCESSQSEPADVEDAYDPATDSLRFAGEVHLRNIRQLTFGGNNAEAYWSFDDQQLIFQSDWDRINDQGCDQIYVMNADGSVLDDGQPYRLTSTGKGRTTCGYFMPEGGRLLFGSTHAAAPECPPTVRFAGDRYVWPLYDTYDIYTVNPDGSDLQVLIGGEGYDAEATLSPDGRYVIFTSTRSGDIELWRYEIETGDLLQLTDILGYDGGAFFSRDSQKIVWRASRPTGEDAAIYQDLLAQNLVEPKALDLYVADIDGSNMQRVTQLPGANWAPFFHPGGEKIIFTSNHHTLDQGGRLFDLFMVNVDGTGMKQITHSGTFDAFPMISFDGTKLVFASNRNLTRTDSRDTNIFVADWIEEPEPVDRAFQGIGAAQ